jgi:hypothetical protein
VKPFVWTLVVATVAPSAAPAADPPAVIRLTVGAQAIS